MRFFGTHIFYELVKYARFAKRDQNRCGNDRVCGHVDTLINERVNERVAHCPVGEAYPNGVLRKENHSRKQVGEKAHREHGDTAKCYRQTVMKSSAKILLKHNLF